MTKELTRLEVEDKLSEVRILWGQMQLIKQELVAQGWTLVCNEFGRPLKVTRIRTEEVSLLDGVEA